MLKPQIKVPNRHLLGIAHLAITLARQQRYYPALLGNYSNAMMQTCQNTQPRIRSWQRRRAMFMLQTWIIIILALFAPTHLAFAKVAAHPLGNFTINHYSRLEVGREKI